MRDDQTKQLDDLGESLMDVFLEDADPRNWPGAGRSPDKLDKETRGNRNWSVKNANQVGALVARVLDLKERIKGNAAHPGGSISGDEAGAEIAKYEKLARDVMAKAGIVSGGR